MAERLAWVLVRSCGCVAGASTRDHGTADEAWGELLGDPRDGYGLRRMPVSEAREMRWVGVDCPHDPTAAVSVRALAAIGLAGSAAGLAEAITAAVAGRPDALDRHLRRPSNEWDLHALMRAAEVLSAAAERVVLERSVRAAREVRGG